MNTITTLITGAAVVAAGTGAAAVLGSTGAASAGTAAASAHTFTVTARHGSESNIDLGASGFSAGDVDLFTGPLIRGGHRAGYMVGSCTTARVAKTADQLCEFVLHLGAGQITASGTVRSGEGGPGTFQLPILGGTGRYATAAGQIGVTATNGRSFPIQVSLR
jgi:hypothetical protein